MITRQPVQGTCFLPNSHKLSRKNKEGFSLRLHTTDAAGHQQRLAHTCLLTPKYTGKLDVHAHKQVACTRLAKQSKLSQRGFNMLGNR